MNFPFRRNANVPPQRVNPNRGSEGCKIAIKRDESGKIVGYKDNGKCSPSQVKSFAEKVGNEDREEE